eukprot:scaffold14974_cov195-Amphora_coffeaeformis.AAC.23
MSRRTRLAMLNRADADFRVPVLVSNSIVPVAPTKRVWAQASNRLEPSRGAGEVPGEWTEQAAKPKAMTMSYTRAAA